ncbi:MAG: CoA transferase [Proteobacteria bacterium]|nr:CoA transferase [Pseudomonadota bacterium]
MSNALNGLRILDFTHMLSGPYATMMLADLGAEVIKIEPPVTGEGTRRLLEKDKQHSVDGMGAYFLTLGRNKKSLALDLKSPSAKKVLHDLVRCSDVVVYNFRAGVGEKLGLHFNQLKEINPRIVTCSVTGFGETGPNRDCTSFDMVAQATGGGMTLTGDGVNPLRSGIPIGDLGGGLMAVIGILSALQARVRTGEGQHIDISMQDAQVSLLNYMATMTSLSGEAPKASGNAHFVHVPYDSFPTRDRHIIIAIITNELWKTFIQTIDIAALDTPENEEQPGRWKNREQITQVLSERLRSRTCDEWLTLLRPAGVPCAPVNDVHAVLNDPHLKARRMIVDVQHAGGRRVQQAGNPIKMSSAGEDSFSPPPLVGQDSQHVLQDILGYSDASLRELTESGAVR